MLNLLRKGLTNAQIADRLDIAAETAKYHVSEILTKLCVATREEAAAWRPVTTTVPQRTGVGAFIFGLKALAFGGSAAAIAGVGVIGYGVIMSGGGGLSPSTASADRDPLPPEQALALAEQAGESDQLVDRPAFGPDFSQMSLGEALQHYAFAGTDVFPDEAEIDVAKPVIVAHYGEFEATREGWCRDLFLIVDEETGDILAQQSDMSECPLWNEADAR